MKMSDNRADQAGKGSKDSNYDVQRGGGSDPRRLMAKNVIDRTVKMHDQSGYNHAYTSNSDSFAKAAEKKAMGMGKQLSDGTREG